MDLQCQQHSSMDENDDGLPKQQQLHHLQTRVVVCIYDLRDVPPVEAFSRMAARSASYCAMVVMLNYKDLSLTAKGEMQ